MGDGAAFMSAGRVRGEDDVRGAGAEGGEAVLPGAERAAEDDGRDSTALAPVDGVDGEAAGVPPVGSAPPLVEGMHSRSSRAC